MMVGGGLMTRVKWMIALAALCMMAWLVQNQSVEAPIEEEKVRSTSSPHASLESKAARAEYFQRMLQDPRTGKIPANIRSREVAFTKKTMQDLPPQKRAANFEWQDLGPTNVGGRTRALVIDIADPNTILAGGVAGGIWKSTDDGATWNLKSSLDHPLSCTALVQDVREGHTQTWYYGTGEWFSSGSARLISGNGIYKSVDNGETWNLLESTRDDNPSTYQNPFDLVKSMALNPVTGTVYVGGNQLMRSADGGESFTEVFGGYRSYVEIAAGSDGSLLAALSHQGAGETDASGIFASDDDGETWTEVTPEFFPDTSERSLIRFAPSDPTIAYILMKAQGQATGGGDNMRIYYFKRDETGAWTSENRTEALPLDASVNSRVLTTQGNYDVTLAVKPDDPNFVVYGGTNLYRTRDGFQTLIHMREMQLGGYGNYTNHHPDQHATTFHPSQPNRLWSGHDGGLSVLEDVTAETISWETRNNGYNVTQFYHVAMGKNADDHRIMGGTQDNGTPFFVWNEGSESSDVSGADGCWSYFGENYMFVSTQFGRVQRIAYEEDPENPAQPLPDTRGNTTFAYPSSADDQMFINYFVVDPLDETIMYYPAGNRVWRNVEIDGEPANNRFIQKWFKPPVLQVEGYEEISAIAVSHEPANRLYFAAWQAGEPTLLYRLDDAHEAEEGRVDISIPDMVPSSWIRQIVINPDNGSEILVVASSYNIPSIFHSLDGGDTWTLVEGNLEGDEDNIGPAVRSAFIHPMEDRTRYWLATTTGIWATDNLNGENTVWRHQATDSLGMTTVDFITGRTSDDRVVAATHGRGLFMATPKAVASRTAPSVRRNDPVTRTTRRGQN